jgi:hypothetical protein
MPVCVKPVLPHRGTRVGNPLSWMACFRIAMRGKARCPRGVSGLAPAQPGLRREVFESGPADDPRSRVRSPGQPGGPASGPMEPAWTPIGAASAGARRRSAEVTLRQADTAPARSRSGTASPRDGAAGLPAARFCLLTELRNVSAGQRLGGCGHGFATLSGMS